MIDTLKKASFNQAGALADNSTAWLMAGLGISAVPFSQFIGGIFLAGFWASIIAKRRNDQRKVWAIWVTAALAAIFVAQFWPLPFLPDWIPVQAAMSIVGGLSGWIITMLILVGDRMELRATDIVDRAIDRVVPGDRDRDDKK